MQYMVLPSLLVKLFFCFRRISNLDLWKVNKNNKKLLDLRSRSAQEQNKVQHRFRKNANDQEETQAVSVTSNSMLKNGEH